MEYKPTGYYFLKRFGSIISDIEEELDNFEYVEEDSLADSEDFESNLENNKK